MSKYVDTLPDEAKPVSSRATEDGTKCPKCGGVMSWVYQDTPRCLTCEASEAKPKSMRSPRYVYHVHGHASLHAPNNVEEAPARPVVPFEVVLRLRYAIDSDEAMESVRQDVRGHVVEQIEKQGIPYVVGDVMIRGVSHLHTILVDADNPEGPAARILT